MKKCVFIIPYFGKFPDSFPVFLKTCAFNKDFDFLLFTDDSRAFDYPDNVRRIIISFEKIKNLIQSKFDFEISLNRPYKLCDYKPAYGFIFEEYIKEYPFWGHCDIDTILGDLGHFLTDDLLGRYEKLFCLGHMILYRNTYENNRVFLKNVQGRNLCRESFSTDAITVFDETYGDGPSINDIFLENGKKVFEEDWSANFKILPTAFTRVKYDHTKKQFCILPKERSLYLWDAGKIYRYHLNDGVLAADEEMYMHFQQRKMRYKNDVLNAKSFKIVPNRFIKTVVNIDSAKVFLKESRPQICFHFLELKMGRLIKRIKKRFGASGGIK